ncbi:uncharacterized protein LOC108739951 [Agrilus planipennis]|uniref:Uncharacterized protein LOC108739951 n=1 Tax=Agrilus planipennis TaxID=224129 RepID=A0A7F5RFV2_AGRPL|nr:uncharacterized protein LOC108739951 [Agrilus planipennis]
MAIHSKHESVLQYKEAFCDVKSNLAEICSGITGDAPLYSMFRKSPESKPVPCPFKSAPFTFNYNRGPGDCSNPPSKAESCTDDSRLVLKYQACPDVPSTESFVEELICLAIWKEGSTRYLVGKVSQGNRRSSTDEDQYRCFIYQRETRGDKTIYNIAQSADATCSGLQSAFEGSKTIKLTTVDNHHNRCKFPVWITDHHTWLSLDHKKTYKFSQGHATLKIVDEESKPNRMHHTYAQQFAFHEFGFQSQDHRRGNTEERVVCHSILQSQEHRKVQIVAHVTAGCDSGYVCMVFYKRDSNVIEIQQSEKYVENPDEACQDFDPSVLRYTTLMTTTLHPKKCPRLGRYSVSNILNEGRRKRRQQQADGEPSKNDPNMCISEDYDSLAVGCSGSKDSMEFKSSCSQKSSAYTCHGNWVENGTYYVVVSPTTTKKSGDSSRYCFMYSAAGPPLLNTALDGQIPPQSRNSIGMLPIMRFSSVAESCNRNTVPGSTGSWFYNFTLNGTCESNSTDSGSLALPSLSVIVTLLLVITFFAR